MIELTIDDINGFLKGDPTKSPKKDTLTYLLQAASIEGLGINALTDDKVYSFFYHNQEYQVKLKGFCLVKSSHTHNGQNEGDNWLFMTPAEYRKQKPNSQQLATVRRAPIYFRVDPNNTSLLIRNKKKLLKIACNNVDGVSYATKQERFENEASILPLLKAGKKEATDRSLTLTLVDRGTDLGIIATQHNHLLTSLDEQSKIYLCLVLMRRLAFMHSKLIIHHDIKFDNIAIPILEHDGEEVLDLENIHLFDFDVSARLKSDDSISTYIGTPGWMSPEKYKAASWRKYDPFKSDLYALALVMGMLFMPDQFNQLIKLNENEKINHILSNNNIPDQMKDFLTNNLSENPTQRHTTDEALETMEAINQEIGLSDTENNESSRIIEIREFRKTVEDNFSITENGNLNNHNNNPQLVELSETNALFKELKELFQDDQELLSSQKPLTENYLIERLKSFKNTPLYEKLDMLEKCFDLIKENKGVLFSAQSYNRTTCCGWGLTPKQIEHMSFLKNAYIDAVKTEVDKNPEIINDSKIKNKLKWSRLIDFNTSKAPKFLQSPWTSRRIELNGLIRTAIEEAKRPEDDKELNKWLARYSRNI